MLILGATLVTAGALLLVVRRRGYRGIHRMGSGSVSLEVEYLWAAEPDVRPPAKVIATPRELPGQARVKGATRKELR